MKTAAPPLPVARTEGCRIVLADGRDLIDGIAAWWTACHGYNHPHIRQAIERQLAVMPHVMFGGLAHEQALTLARRVAALLPGGLDPACFSESGSVAVEIAMKMALQYWRNRGMRGRSKFVAFKGGYHGDTTGAMAVSDEEGMHAAYRGALPENFIIDLPRDEAGTTTFEGILEGYAEEIAAIIVEPLVQGAGGMKFHEPHGDDVRLRGGGCGAGHHYTVQGADGRHAAIGGNGGAHKGLRRFLVGRPQARAHARPDLHGQRPGLRGR